MRADQLGFRPWTFLGAQSYPELQLQRYFVGVPARGDVPAIRGEIGENTNDAMAIRIRRI